ncbi:hypothetical protein PIROE2DRAFT_10706 [Piromyces sp. E2]|nr:hypothetical protein PIROE2DRAFT_10706 [Piromyces sp. E2]|eukprot:OUM62899.1 hypothetical protein PIROE2DRAFT_10706 [Piromyces sp. E2]
MQSYLTTTFLLLGQRAKLFELTDNVISVFKVTLPDEEYKTLVEKCQYADPLLDTDWTNYNPEQDYEEFKANSAKSEPFKTKNATLSVNINGEEKSFNKVTFSLGGSSARSRGRQSFNLKIRGDKDLYGRSQFRLRSDSVEPTTIRSKLACDMHNRLGLVSISANYISLYINDDYMGLYVLMDAPKVSWAKLAYNDENTTNMYKCKEALNDLSVLNSSTGCINENDEITENPEWIDFLTTLDNAQSAQDIEDIFDVDQFLYEIAYEYLAGSCDHYLFNGHNFNVYKVKGGKWTMISYDFDVDLGQNVHYVGIYPHSTNSTDYPSYSFDEWISLKQHLIDILILKDRTRFESILKQFVVKVFNPTILFPHIDEIKNLIRSEKIREKTPDANGNIPGVINKKGNKDYSIEQWEANSEFTTVSDNVMNTGYGLKYWILMKYRYVCKAYHIDCDPTYLDENYQYPIDKDVEAFFIVNDFSGFGDPNKTPDTIANVTEMTSSTISTAHSTITITSTLTTTTTTTDRKATATTISSDDSDDDNEIEIDVDTSDIANESNSDSEENN